MNYHVLMIVPTIVIIQLLIQSSAFSIRELTKGGGKRMDARSK
jgi:hypothetical protein